jgi:SAM-dependent methyltransferase
MDAGETEEIISKWQLPARGSLTDRINAMIRVDLMKGFFGSSSTLIVGGVQYHLGGVRDTEELADLASISSSDQVLDVASFLGGPALQLADSYRCTVKGVDRNEKCVLAANKIAELCGLSHLVEFYAADACDIPFNDNAFSVVWSQCSLAHDERWLQEFDRVLQRRGRLALTFAIRRENPDQKSPKWTLNEVASRIRNRGYFLLHVDDITSRDIKWGWKVLDTHLSIQENDFTRVLGAQWVRNAHQRFEREIELMRRGQWGNGRIIAVKTS